ncbi:DNA-methyltransferase [Undibacterium sp. Rencai35W]|uniref:DNA-methyltransferase n=1 Tax=Undibacterium sp. Rencai35W TaxID=3413046 RepID=UPI003BF0F4C0
MKEIDLRCGDALHLLKALKSDSIDLIVTDPPYNLGKDYGNNHDLKGFDEYMKFTQDWLREAKRVLKPNGTIYVFMGVRFISYIYDIMDRELGLFFNSWIVWHYTQGLGKTRGFSPRHDDILVFSKGKDFLFNLDDIRIPQKFYRERNNMRGANPGDVWEFSHVHYSNPNRQNHPTQKPEGLIARMVLASSNVNDLVLDPFVGSGTTLRVCQQLNRKALGFELNPDYVSLVKQRLNEPFQGFDSIDPRMERIPNDLRDATIRKEYLNNHIDWFLKHHPRKIAEFEKLVREKYGEILDINKKISPQEKLF